MSSPLSNPNATLEAPAEALSLHAMLRFLRAVRFRKKVMFVALVVSALLGVLYYSTTPRVYESKATLLVLHTGDDWTPEMQAGKSTQDLMTTYRNLFVSEAVINQALTSLPPEGRFDLAGSPREAWPKILGRNLNVSVVKSTNILEVGYRSQDPEAAFAVVNSMVTAYLDFMNNLYQSQTGEILQILTKEKTSLEEQLREKEQEKQDIRTRAKDLVLRGGNRDVNVIMERVVELNQALIAAHEKRLSAQAEVVAIQQAIAKGEDLQQFALEMVSDVGSQVISHAIGLSSNDASTTSRVKQQLFIDKAELQAKLEHYGPAHHKIRQLEQRIQVADQYLRFQQQIERVQLRQASNQELAPMLEQMARQKLDKTIAHEQSIYASYEKEKQAAIEMDHTMAKLETLELDLNRLRGFYDVILQRYTDLDLGQENGALRTSVLSESQVPTGPVWPKPHIVALLSLFLGTAVGLVIVYLQELLYDHFRSPEEIRTELGVPVLAMIRRMDPVADCGIDAVHVHVRPNAAETESFRTLRTALAFTEGGAQRLVVSSSEPGDGKTTLVSNLAVAYAQSGKRTLLIDADMRRPGLTPLLDLKGPKGLSVVLRGVGPIDQAVAENVFPSIATNLDVIPSGPRPINPTELLGSARFSELLSWAETHYDQILVDSPPALVSDTAIIGRLVDGVLLALQPEKNRRRVVIRATESFSGLGIKVLGVVINRLANENEKDYYGYDYGYGYSYSYSYGHDDEPGNEIAYENEEDDWAETPLQPPQIIRRAA